MAHVDAADSKGSAGAPEIEVTDGMIDAADGISVDRDDRWTERKRAYAAIFASMVMRSGHPAMAGIKRVVLDGSVVAHREA
jgi:hypothetical protein